VLNYQKVRKLTNAEKAELEEREIIEETEKMENNWTKWRTVEQGFDEEPKAEGLHIEVGESKEFEREEIDKQELVDYHERAELEIDEKDPDLDYESFCLDCAHRPCLCMLLKIEMTISSLKREFWTPEHDQKGEIPNNGVGIAEVSVQKIPPPLYCNQCTQILNRTNIFQNRTKSGPLFKANPDLFRTNFQ